MKSTKRVFTLLLAALMMCVLLAGYAFAAEEDALWLVMEEPSDEVSAVVQTNAVVVSGVVTVTFDTEKLTYVGCDFVGEDQAYADYVAMHSVNDTEAASGTIRIAWVAPEAYSLENREHSLFRICFQAVPEYSGEVSEKDFAITGDINNQAGLAVPVGEMPTEPETEPSEPGTEPTEPSETTAPTETTVPTEPSETTAPGESTDTSTSTEEGGSTPPTGDNTNLVLLGTMLVISGAFLVSIGMWNYKRRGA